MRVLLSIKPEYAERIFNGSKRFEFRKAIFRNPDVHTVVVYATQPVGKVIGEFAIQEIIDGEPSAIWRRTHRHSGISQRFFDDYFHGRSRAFAIKVKSTKRYHRPKELQDVIPGGVAPQSFRYLSAT